MRGKTASPSQAFRGRAGKLSFSGRKTGISGQGNAGGTAHTSGGRVRLQDKDSEKCYAKAAENISEHGNSGRNSAGSFVVVISYNIWENCLENGYVKADNGKKGGPLGSQYYFQNSCCGDSGLRTFSGPETQRQRGTGFFSQPGRASCGTLLDRTIYLVSAEQTENT